MLQSPTTTWGVQSFTLSILEKKNRNTKQCLRGERRKLYQIQNPILQIYTPISTPLEVAKIPTTKSFDHLSTPPKKRKIPQNSTSSSHQIAFLQQNLDHNHKNLSCNLPPLQPSASSYGWPALYASVLLGAVFGLLSMFAALAVMLPATLVTWITIVVMLAFFGKPRRTLVVEGRKITREIFVIVIKILLKEGNLVAAACAVLGYFALFRRSAEVIE
ncbi:uncharacterized protein LOC110766990 [Prunus avium]|uniref:Uncharacterized protein LOC110766990 n=1 Tax=Prunus avium TaxID=42229 RepID=A0A6P5TGD3_PRUAV|nr:uncharacterized protein LOC110766990 [Prunus avium]